MSKKASAVDYARADAPAPWEGENHVPIVSIRNATVVAENGARILDDVSFEVRAGEHTAVLGPNGSGKSSLIKLITQHYRPYAHRDNAGSVVVFGKERWNVFELRTILGIVSADLHQTFVRAQGHVTALEAVISGFFASERLFDHHEVTEPMRARGRAALDLMEIPHLANRPVEEMSTGEARRVLIARALAPNPRALILDEPTTGLDFVARHRFLETLRNVARHGTTIVLVTHHVEEIFPEVERVILLRRGRVLCNGSKADTMTSPNLSAAYEASIQTDQDRDGYFTATASQS